MNPANSQAANPSSDSKELLERGRLTLQAIQYHERAARYMAAAASLQAAMLQAENGNAAKLYEWLESESHQFDTEIDFSLKTADEGTDVPSPTRSLRIDSVTPKSGAHFRIPLHAEADSSATITEIKSAPSNESDSDIKSTEGSEQIIAPSASQESRWSSMEKGAIARLASDAIDNQEQEVVETKTSGALEDWDSDSDSDLKETVKLPTELIVALAEFEGDSCEHRTKAWWKAPHVWVSLAVHVVLVICLSIIVATVAAEPKLLAIVSASVESDHVLMETPMEMISELESSSEPTQSLPAPSLSDMTTDIAIPTSAIEPGSMPTATPSVSSALSGAASELSQASMSGSKMLSGAEFFGVKATGNTFVYIVDSSPSMRRDGAFDAAKAEIMRSLHSMKPKQRYFISFFGKEIDPMVFKTGEVEKYPVYAKPENLTKTIEWLNRIQIQKEGLPPNNALSEAIAMQPDGIFLLFDGDTRSDVAKYLRKANRTDDILSAGKPKVPIHVVHFFQEEFQKQMRQVAEENGGTYRFVPRPERPSKK